MADAATHPHKVMKSLRDGNYIHDFFLIKPTLFKSSNHEMWNEYPAKHAGSGSNGAERAETWRALGKVLALRWTEKHMSTLNQRARTETGSAPMKEVKREHRILPVNPKEAEGGIRDEANEDYVAG